MCDANMRALLWLDLCALVQRICPKEAHVLAVKYVTARILNLRSTSHAKYAAEEASRSRQSEYIDALIARGVRVFEGKFKRRTITCRTCGSTWPKPEEKASDVHLATQLLCDAFRREFDVAMIVSGDADVSPAARVVVDELKLQLIVAFPPKRVLNELKAISTDHIHINRHQLAKSQLPDRFVHGAHVFRRPVEWGGKP